MVLSFHRLPLGWQALVKRYGRRLGISGTMFLERTPKMPVPAQHAWLEMLGTTNAKRAEAIADLIDHAGEDGMSADDLLVCLRQWTRISRQAAA